MGLKKSIAGFVAGAGLTRAAAWWHRFHPVILMYHGVTEAAGRRDWTQVDLSDFKAQMQYLKSHYQICPLGEIIALLASGKIEPHAAAVTFDDGYKSNHDLAYPILKRMGIPATIFVTSGFISGEGMTFAYLWPDFVTALILSHPEPSLDIRHLNLGQWELPSLRTRYEARTAICERLKSMPNPDRQRLVQGLARDYGGLIDHDRFRDYRPMTPAEVRNLATDELVTIGAHSRTHPILSRLERDGMADEIIGGKKDLETMTGQAVTQFAYPNGRRQDISREALDLVTQNFECAVTTEAGINPPGQNKYLLRRIGVGRNLPLAQFTVLISGAYFTLQKAIHKL